jgi:hypothetical protein
VFKTIFWVAAATLRSTAKMSGIALHDKSQIQKGVASRDKQ